MAKPTVLNPPAWADAWPGVVTAVKVETPAFFNSAYEVFLDGKSIGFVVSRQERGHTTLWDSVKTLDGSSDERAVPRVPSRASAVDDLVASAR